MAGRYPDVDDFMALGAGLASLGKHAESQLVSSDAIATAVPNISRSKLRVMMTTLKDRRLSRAKRDGQIEISPKLFTASLESLGEEYAARRERQRWTLVAAGQKRSR